MLTRNPESRTPIKLIWVNIFQFQLVHVPNVVPMEPPYQVVGGLGVCYALIVDITGDSTHRINNLLT